MALKPVCGTNFGYCAPATLPPNPESGTDLARGSTSGTGFWYREESSCSPPVLRSYDGVRHSSALRNQTEATMISAHLVPGMWFLRVWCRGVYPDALIPYPRSRVLYWPSLIEMTHNDRAYLLRMRYKKLGTALPYVPICVIRQAPY